MMIVSLILAVLALTGLVSIWHIIGASILQGLIASIETPTRYAFIVDIIKKKKILLMQLLYILLYLVVQGL